MARPENLGDEAVLAHYQELAVSPLPDKVCRESLRIVPPVHSSLRVATQDDVLPVSNGEAIRKARRDELGPRNMGKGWVGIQVSAV